jgi:ADP-L-glycero-D-manno-heptose 6-epimerase
MIVLTGAAGFIGSCTLAYFNELGINDFLLVDKLGEKNKWKNLLNKKFIDFIDREQFIFDLDEYDNIDFIIHIGACSDTTEFNVDYLMEVNYEYSKLLFEFASYREIPIIYASSAATYGNGENGYDDDESKIFNLSPLNPYGFSKQIFDQWVLQQEIKPPYWAGLKFFNVYGPNEYHKGRMASVIFHAYNQLLETGKIRLFKSHKDGFNDGEQLRDFVYVKDVVKVIHYLYETRKKSGIYNIGSGKARTFKDLATAVINETMPSAKIEYFDMPEDIREKYQYFTEANMKKLASIGYNEKFYSLEDGIKDYIKSYLSKNYSYY